MRRVCFTLSVCTTWATCLSVVCLLYTFLFKPNPAAPEQQVRTEVMSLRRVLMCQSTTKSGIEFLSRRVCSPKSVVRRTLCAAASGVGQQKNEKHVLHDDYKHYTTLAVTEPAHSVMQACTAMFPVGVCSWLVLINRRVLCC